MRVVLLGASPLAVSAARLLVGNRHEVVLVEKDEARIEEIEDELDCGFIHGDGSRPSVLREVSPENTDFLMCMTDSDQDNIIAALVGRKQGFERIVVQITDPDFESICSELDIDETIIPTREAGRALSDLVEGIQHADLLAIVRDGVRFVAVAVSEDEAGPLSGLDLPDSVTACVLTRDEASRLVHEDTDLKAGDELLLAVADAEVEAVQERFKDKVTRSRRPTSRQREEDR